ncbi:MAG: hypothetical protein DMG74_21510 [Acidobacteria bacterium]|nr:MAG: hypothetical protein DMG74_21510 [Acidobacteriota bacterium]
MLVNRKYDKATILIIAAGLLAYASFQPKFRLRTALPREFIDESSSWPAEKRVSEEKVARAYWNCAVTQIQWKYGYGHRLPQDVPPEFAVSTEELGPTADDPATRARFWRKLRQVWYLPSIWEKDYGWVLPPITNSLRSGGEWLQHQIQRITGSP